MRFASILTDDKRLAVALEGDWAIPLIGHDELGVNTSSSVLAEVELDHSRRIRVDEARFLPIVPNPRKIICVGLNYRAHVSESLRDEPTYPVLFSKFATSLTGANDPVACPPESVAVDYEGEVAVVIGKRIRRVSEVDALRMVAGYAAANDITMRDFQNLSHQWLQGKAWDRSTPIGPALVTPEEAGDPENLTIRTTVNGTVVQEANTGQMIFPIKRLISTISEFATLEPGDIILTGTPAGVGFRREPPLLLAPGDRITVEVAGVGRTETVMAAELV